MAKKYKYIKRVRTKSGNWRYIYETPGTSQKSDDLDAQLQDAAEKLGKGLKLTLQTGKKLGKAGAKAAYKGAKSAYKATESGLKAARKSSEAATERRKQQQAAKVPSVRDANTYKPEDPYKPNKPWRGSSADSARGKKATKPAAKRGSVYVGPADRMTDMNDAVVRPKKRKRGGTSMKSTSGR